MKCLICDDNIEYDSAYFARIHLKVHNITPKLYYDTYLTKSNDGICKKCGNPTRYMSITLGYRQYCSSKCSNSDSNVLIKKQITCNKNYGVDHPLQSNVIKSKIISTNIEKYGVEWGLANSDIKNNIKNTNLEKYGVDNQFKRLSYIKNSIYDKYGVDNVSKLTYIRDKANITLYRNYGVLHPLQNVNLLNKSHNTLYKNYSVETPLKSPEILNKYKSTIQSLYNVSHVMNSDIIKNKVKQTCLDIYGYESPMKNHKVVEKMTTTKREIYWGIFLKKMKYKNLIPDISLDDYKNNDIVYSVKCTLCNNVFNTTHHNPQRISCGCLKTRSQEENQVVEFINDELGIFNIIQNKIFNDKRDRYELDIYLPDYNIGIELDGLYWHSELYKPRLYHKHKTNFFRNIGINIIHVFDYEWKNKKDIVKSIIRSKLNLGNAIYARKCVVKELSNNDINTFLINNHLQGYVSCSVKLGLYYNESIIACMTFSKSRYSNKYEYELVRFCNKLNTVCIGGFSKLLSYFNKKYTPTTIISYCDLRYFDSHSYESNGFKLINITEPNYYYFKQNIIYTRIACQKHKLNKLLDKFDASKSESENMLNAGFLRIYDCGNKVLLYDNNINNNKVN